MNALVSDQDRASAIAVYAQVGENYRAIDDIRLRLLALLPLATGTGILVFTSNHSIPADVSLPVGVFGMIATLSLYIYELHGIEKCAHFIYRGALIEQDLLEVPGSFTLRPRNIFGVVSELVPAAVIYPASLAGWLFLALYRTASPGTRTVATAVTFAIGVVVSLTMIIVMENTRACRRARLAEALARAGEAGPPPCGQGSGDADRDYSRAPV